MAFRTPPAFVGIDNFRDFGDAPAAGGRVRKGRLYRSAHHGRATDEDLEALRDLGLAVIVDLRRPEERAREPSRRHPGILARVIEDERPDDGADAYRTFLLTTALTEASIRSFLLDYYQKAPFEPRIAALCRRTFEALAEADGPILIHCAAGKDRTGILAALIHHVLEVPFERTLADYLLTNDPERIAKRAGPYADHIHEISGRRPAPEAVMAALAVEGDYLQTCFAAIAGRPGGVDAYLEEVLGVSPNLRRAIRARVVEPG
jgi:protein tyrosine/serine phosphatase